MNAITQSVVTHGQIRQIARFGSDAIERALKEIPLDNPGAQRVIEHGDEFASGIRDTVIKLLSNLSVSDRFSSEMAEADHGYSSGYDNGAREITTQVSILKELFPDLADCTYDVKCLKIPLPRNAEGRFAIPQWQKIAPTYNEAVKKVLRVLKNSRNGAFFNCREGQISRDNLRQSQKNSWAFERFCNEQAGHDILVVPAQFGLRHAGLSVRRANEVMSANEFGLDTFSVCIMLLTHPERLSEMNVLWIDCAGDEYRPSDQDPNEGFNASPSFTFVGNRIEYGAYQSDYPNGHYGSASGFLNQI